MKDGMLTISGYEYRLEIYLKGVYDIGSHLGVKIFYFREIWDLSDIGYGRVKKAAQRLCKRGILLRPIVNGKVLLGTYKYNPDYRTNRK